MPSPRLPDDIEAIASQIPVYPRGLAELRARLASLPALSPSGLPGVTLAEFPESDGTVATSGGTTGGAQGTMTTPDGPGTVPGSVITPNTLPSTALAANLRPPKIVSSLPALPDADFPTGTLVYNIGESPAKLYRNNDDGTWAAAVSGGEILANSITAGQIEAGAIGATELAATIILGSIIKTADTGRRVEISEAGIDLIDADGVTVLVRIPTNGEAVKVVGEVEASVLESTSAATFRGETALAKGSTTTVEDVVGPPTAPPVLTRGYETLNSTDGNDPNDWGLVWNGAHLCALGRVGSDVKILRYTTAGVLSSTIATDLSTSDLLNGLAHDGTNFWILRTDGTTVRIVKLNSSGVVQNTTTVTTDVTGDKSTPGLFWDGTASRLIMLTHTGTGGTANARLRLYDVSGGTPSLSSTLDTTGNPLGGGVAECFIPGGVRVGSEYWVQTYGSSGQAGVIYAYNASTGAVVSSRGWGYRASDGAKNYAVAGLGYDGTNFYFRNTSDDLMKASNWDWTTESALYWVGYSWRDGAGTTHETPAGPRTSITMYRRMFLTVQNAAIPVGGAEDPDSVRVYMERNASQPSAGSYKLQVTDALTSRILSTFATGGDPDPTTNDFPGGSSAELRSQATPGWALYGDGTVEFEDVDVNGDVAIVGGLAVGGPVTDDLGGFTNYTPSVTNGGTATYTERTGYSLKVGPLVFVSIRLEINSAGSGGGGISLSLPFAPAGPFTQILPGRVEGFGTIIEGPVVGQLTAGSDIANVRCPNGAGAAVSLNRSHFVNGASLVLEGWYRST